MNYHKRVLWFVLIITFSLFILSFITEALGIEWKPFKNISILSDIVRHKEKKIDTIAVAEPEVTTKDSLHKKFIAFDLPNRVTAYYVDSSNIVLKNFMNKLAELKQGKRKKIRIAFLGDSMIEDDFITATLRRLMQQEFGGYGVGYLPMSSELAGARTTANIFSSGNWQEANFRNNPDKQTLFISGRSFTASGNAWTEVQDKTAMPNQPLNKYLLYGKTGNASINCNNVTINLSGKQGFNSIVIDSSANNRVKVEIGAGVPVFGISLEAANGITVDNFSFRGNSGQEFAKMDSTFLATIASNHAYDLVIMQYGVNLFDKPSDEKFDWYYLPMKKSVNRIKSAFADADVLLLSCADRSFRYGTDYKTAIGMPVILAMQQRIAYENGIAFYNMFTSMGGDGSMVKWVNDKPALAYKDYMHPNDKGSELIGKSLFDALMFEYQKLSKPKK